MYKKEKFIYRAFFTLSYKTLYNKISKSEK